MSNSIYTDKYPDSEAVRFVNPNDINNADECRWLIEQFDNIRLSIEKQIGDSRTNKLEGLPVDRDWYVSTKYALKKTNLKRSLLQTKLGALNKANKVRRAEKLEHAFMQTTLKIASVELVRQIWAQLYVDYPELSKGEE